MGTRPTELSLIRRNDKPEAATSCLHCVSRWYLAGQPTRFHAAAMLATAWLYHKIRDIRAQNAAAMTHATLGRAVYAKKNEVYVFPLYNKPQFSNENNSRIKLQENTIFYLITCKDIACAFSPRSHHASDGANRRLSLSCRVRPHLRHRRREPPTATTPAATSVPFEARGGYCNSTSIIEPSVIALGRLEGEPHS
ncbi:hypothetical protein EVAR_96230_1 [Eumeta japonica]|uniref:Uncharacterized protein n=1 Tax=Eumeta variegata TaxID=151549 RepID=A0A4C1WND4_EUMVA|nr:hypothetical protein EVAR_96230_1 [Eumeta japonica]